MLDCQDMTGERDDTHRTRTMPGAHLSHAVRDGCERAVCGTAPGRTSTWLPGGPLNCPRCADRLAFARQKPSRWGERRQPRARA
jgi:hypothetical protein